MKSNFNKLICCVHICFLLTCVIDLNAQYVFHEYGDTTYIDVGNDKQLFIDDYFIESKKSIDFVMNPPYQTGEILIEADLPHEKEEHVYLYSSVIKNKEGKIRIWYDVSIPDRGRSVGYAESEDGIHFEKPILGKYEVNGSKKNNIVFPPEANGGTSVWIDPMASAEHRYKTQSKVYPSGELHIYSSPDGINWSFYANVDPRGGPVDTQTIIFWDENIGKYLLFSRGKIYGRSVRRAEMKDLNSIENTGFVVWTDITDQYTYFSERADRTEPENLANDTPMDYYGATVFPYENVYIVLAQAFWHWIERDPRDLRPGTRRPGTRDVRLLISRDSKEFTRVGSRKAFMGPGPFGRFDSKQIWAMPNPIVMDDEIWIYYNGTNWDRAGRIDPEAPDGRKRSAISRAIMRLDGFVSADAPYGGGEIITKPLKFKGNKLEINANTAAGGSIRVEILDSYGYPIPGFSINEANWINGNSVRLPVSWSNDNDLESLNGKIIRLRFVMQDCKLYSFQFINKISSNQN